MSIIPSGALVLFHTSLGPQWSQSAIYAVNLVFLMRFCQLQRNQVLSKIFQLDRPTPSIFRRAEFRRFRRSNFSEKPVFQRKPHRSEMLIRSEFVNQCFYLLCSSLAAESFSFLELAIWIVCENNLSLLRRAQALAIGKFPKRNIISISPSSKVSGTKGFKSGWFALATKCF